MFKDVFIDELSKQAFLKSLIRGAPKLLKTTASPLNKATKTIVRGMKAKRMIKMAEDDCKDMIPGGKGDGKDDDDFPKKELAKGKKVEKEHTKSKKKASEIAHDHLSEDKKYYSKLQEIGLADELGKNAFIEGIMETVDSILDRRRELENGEAAVNGTEAFRSGIIVGLTNAAEIACQKAVEAR